MSSENLKTETLSRSSLEINFEDNLPKKESKLAKYKFIYSSWGIFFLIVLILGIIAIIITGTSPCVHTKCHSLATCVNKPFYADCVCKYGYAGNGRDHCDECGLTYYKQNADENGERAVPYSWPATAIIESQYTTLIKLETQRILLFNQEECSGVLINRKTILTSANCFDGQFDYNDYFSGKTYKINVTLNNFHPTLESIYNIYTGTDEYVYYYTDLPHVEVDDFDQVIIHPEFNLATLENNLAIVKLKNEARINRYIQIACLPNKTSTNTPDVNLGKLSLYIAGYSSAGSSYTSWSLQNLLFDMFNTSMCDKVHPENTKNWDRQFCAGEYNDYGNITGVCHGDYGSAAYFYDEVNGVKKYIAAGILSYDVPCSTNHSPGVYTRLSYYLDWINQN